MDSLKLKKKEQQPEPQQPVVSGYGDEVVTYKPRQRPELDFSKGNVSLKPMGLKLPGQ